ncbi:helix-turn-helix transcriptional regulator [Pseudomaricurvus alkylphenolicus]|uniref:TetR/AcrR family transcriptional regulator n=1 Tax=Pseudomaricurvus alkylphenolicus TaxID=1306991 RepID=UPI00141E4F96|nr:TetR family transcriptional regulator [Pseudomaricurvus alkylphenolicus]NIB41618.1 helix-turn-helix transcriptional regulator [Pseudomaricurvus alkylphenolicus]
MPGLETAAEVARNKLGAKGLQRRAELMAVARDLLLNEGVDNVVLRQVAAAANVKLGHLQYYFPTRDDLLEALFCEAWEGDEATIHEGASAEDLESIISNLLVGWAGDRGRIYLVLTLRSFHDQRFYELKRRIYFKFYDEMVVLLKKIHPDRSRPELLRKAKIFTSLLDGAMFQMHSGGEDEVRRQTTRFHSDLKDAAMMLVLN